MDSSIPEQLIRQALTIRRFEELLFDLYAQGLVQGTLHTCIGQEWTGVALAAATSDDDFFVSNHRGHGHFLARTGDYRGLLAEIMGRSTGVCGGVGGTQHLRAKNYFSNGIQGGMVPVAAGAAFARKLSGSGHIALACIGDGTLGEGVIYESMNVAARWELPLLVVVENNRVAQSTLSSATFSGDIATRAMGFGLQYRKADTWHPEKLIGLVADAVSEVRRNSTPLLLEIETDRLKAHSKGDDNRPRELVESFTARDVLSGWLADPDPQIKRLLHEIDHELAEAVAETRNQPSCTFSSLSSDALADCSWSPQPKLNGSIRYIDALSTSLQGLFSDRTDTILIGEDIEGPYGGAFKATRDLSLKYLDRVRNTPISEAAIIGIGTGLALSGMKPLVEIMFGDFLTLGFDQLFQHASKFTQIYGEPVPVPLIVRTPMGGRRGYGPTHSQSIEKFFLGVSGLQIVALNQRLDPSPVFRELISDSQLPTIVIENKVMYTRPLVSESPPGFESLVSDEAIPSIRISPCAPASPEVTIICYGGMLGDSEGALEKLFREYEIIAEIICPGRIAPLNLYPILASVQHTHRLVTVEEGPGIAGFGTEVLAALLEKGVCCTFRRVHYSGIIPSSASRENDLLPDVRAICSAVLELFAHG